MATACESDSEMQGGTTDIGRDVLRQSSDSRHGPASSEASSAPIHRLLEIRSQGVCTSPGQKCCTGCGLFRGMSPDSATSVGMTECTPTPFLLQHSSNQTSAANGLGRTISASTAAINFGASSAHQDVPSISDHYYTYIQAVKALAVKSDMTVGKLQHCLKHFSCSGKPRSHSLFPSSSAICTAENVDELFAAVQQLSSWYNHTLVTHLAVSLLGDEGRALADRYSTTLTGQCAAMLLLLPQPSFGCSCPDNFEEIFVDVERAAQSCSLADTVRVHATLADMFEVNSGALFLAGIKEGKTSGSSVITFWLPRSLSSRAVNAALGNSSTMNGEEITRIRTKYETISAAPPKDQTSNHGRLSTGVAESGYETQNFSSSTLNVLSNRSASHCHDSQSDDSVEEELDEVFITEVSPDVTSDVPNLDQRYVFGRYSVDSSPDDWSPDTDSERSHTESDHTHTILPPATCSNDNEKERIGGESADDADEALEGKLEKAESVSSPKLIDDQEEATEVNEHLQISPSMPDADANMEESVSLMHSAGMQVQERRKDGIRQRGLNTSEESIYVAMSSAPATLPETTLPGGSSTAPHYQQINPLHRFSYCIIRCNQSSFVKRVLRRASEKWPANLQMVAITGYEGLESEGALEVGRAQRLTALYSKGLNIIAATISGDVGGIPYSSCRLSKSYYGRTSKSAVLDTTQFYSISTMCIHKVSSFTAEQVYPGETVDIDFIIIRSHSAADKDELDVCVGDYIRMLYCDENWVYGCNRNRQAGFIPRDNCRLVKKSDELLRHCHWITQSFRFQADFVFDLTKPPPPHLLHNLFLPNEDMGKTMMLARSYTPPGSRCTIQRGVPLKIIYTENRLFFYVAISNGMTFWIPALYCQSFSLKRRHSSYPFSRSNEDLSTEETGMLPCFGHPRSYSVRVCSPKRKKKKVSFAPSVDKSELLCHSNPGLSSALPVDKAKSPAFPPRFPARRARSSDAMQVFMLMNEDSPTTFCSTGCSFFCF